MVESPALLRAANVSRLFKENINQDPPRMRQVSNTGNKALSRLRRHNGARLSKHVKTQSGSQNPLASSRPAMHHRTRSCGPCRYNRGMVFVIPTPVSREPTEPLPWHRHPREPSFPDFHQSFSNTSAQTYKETTGARASADQPNYKRVHRSIPVR